MFFFVLTSHSVGTFFIDETMLRSGVPPHIGQLPVPGSEATQRRSRDEDDGGDGVTDM